jgi:hypothetical protein
MAVRSKLAQARLKFLEANAKKTGKNMNMQFMYFELSDIVPIALPIFAELGLVTVTNFDDKEGVASMTVFDSEDDGEGITFTAPYREIAPIISNAGKQVTNELQALGSSITYLRRYLWMMVLDIVEHDDIDGELIGKEEKPAPKKEKKQSKPKTAEERKEIAKEVVVNEDATPDQIRELKDICKELLKKDPTQEELIQNIALKTNGFTTIKANACAELIENIRGMINA